MGDITAQMFLQTSGDVAVLGECCLIESFAFPVENKSLAEFLNFERPANRFSGPFPMRQALAAIDGLNGLRPLRGRAEIMKHNQS